MLSAGPSASSFQLEHQQQQQHIYFEPSRNDLSFATSPQPANPAIESKALLLHPKRPVSFATHHTTLPLPVSKLATLVKPLTRLPRHRRPAHQAEEEAATRRMAGKIAVVVNLHLRSARFGAHSQASIPPFQLCALYFLLLRESLAHSIRTFTRISLSLSDACTCAHPALYDVRLGSRPELI